ncbi:hypothetical protein DIPPA_21100 [Diplonema papillatum]|nr:hypothetical protein DIPPA_21100 [Diplonema papillatum]
MTNDGGRSRKRRQRNKAKPAAASAARGPLDEQRGAEEEATVDEGHTAAPVPLPPSPPAPQPEEEEDRSRAAGGSGPPSAAQTVEPTVQDEGRPPLLGLGPQSGASAPPPVCAVRLVSQQQGGDHAEREPSQQSGDRVSPTLIAEPAAQCDHQSPCKSEANPQSGDRLPPTLIAEPAAQCDRQSPSGELEANPQFGGRLPPTLIAETAAQGVNLEPAERFPCAQSECPTGHIAEDQPNTPNTTTPDPRSGSSFPPTTDAAAPADSAASASRPAEGVEPMPGGAVVSASAPALPPPCSAQIHPSMLDQPEGRIAPTDGEASATTLGSMHTKECETSGSTEETVDPPDSAPLPASRDTVPTTTAAPVEATAEKTSRELEAAAPDSRDLSASQDAVKTTSTAGPSESLAEASHELVVAAETPDSAPLPTSQDTLPTTTAAPIESIAETTSRALAADDTRDPSASQDAAAPAETPVSPPLPVSQDTLPTTTAAPVEAVAETTSRELPAAAPDSRELSASQDTAPAAAAPAEKTSRELVAVAETPVSPPLSASQDTLPTTTAAPVASTAAPDSRDPSASQDAAPAAAAPTESIAEETSREPTGAAEALGSPELSASQDTLPTTTAAPVASTAAPDSRDPSASQDAAPAAAAPIESIAEETSREPTGAAEALGSPELSASQDTLPTTTAAPVASTAAPDSRDPSASQDAAPAAAAPIESIAEGTSREPTGAAEAPGSPELSASRGSPDKKEPEASSSLSSGTVGPVESSPKEDAKPAPSRELTAAAEAPSSRPRTHDGGEEEARINESWLSGSERPSLPCVTAIEGSESDGGSRGLRLAADQHELSLSLAGAQFFAFASPPLTPLLPRLDAEHSMTLPQGLLLELAAHMNGSNKDADLQLQAPPPRPGSVASTAWLTPPATPALSRQEASSLATAFLNARSVSLGESLHHVAPAEEHNTSQLEWLDDDSGRDLAECRSVGSTAAGWWSTVSGPAPVPSVVRTPSILSLETADNDIVGDARDTRRDGCPVNGRATPVNWQTPPVSPHVDEGLFVHDELRACPGTSTARRRPKRHRSSLLAQLRGYSSDVPLSTTFPPRAPRRRQAPTASGTDSDDEAPLRPTAPRLKRRKKAAVNQLPAAAPSFRPRASTFEAAASLAEHPASWQEPTLRTGLQTVATAGGSSGSEKEAVLRARASQGVSRDETVRGGGAASSDTDATDPQSGCVGPPRRRPRVMTMQLAASEDFRSAVDDGTECEDLMLFARPPLEVLSSWASPPRTPMHPHGAGRASHTAEVGVDTLSQASRDDDATSLLPPSEAAGCLATDAQSGGVRSPRRRPRVMTMQLAASEDYRSAVDDGTECEDLMLFARPPLEVLSSWASPPMTPMQPHGAAQAGHTAGVGADTQSQASRDDDAASLLPPSEAAGYPESGWETPFSSAPDPPRRRPPKPAPRRRRSVEAPGSKGRGLQTSLPRHRLIAGIPAAEPGSTDGEESDVPRAGTPGVRAAHARRPKSDGTRSDEDEAKEPKWACPSISASACESSIFYKSSEDRSPCSDDEQPPASAFSPSIAVDPVERIVYAPGIDATAYPTAFSKGLRHRRRQSAGGGFGGSDDEATRGALRPRKRLGLVGHGDILRLEAERRLMSSTSLSCAWTASSSQRPSLPSGAESSRDGNDVSPPYSPHTPSFSPTSSYPPFANTCIARSTTWAGDEDDEEPVGLAVGGLGRRAQSSVELFPNTMGGIYMTAPFRRRTAFLTTPYSKDALMLLRRRNNSHFLPSMLPEHQGWEVPAEQRFMKRTFVVLGWLYSWLHTVLAWYIIYLTIKDPGVIRMYSPYFKVVQFSGRMLFPVLDAFVGLKYADAALWVGSQIGYFRALGRISGNWLKLNSNASPPPSAGALESSLFYLHWTLDFLYFPTETLGLIEWKARSWAAKPKVLFQQMNVVVWFWRQVLIVALMVHALATGTLSLSWHAAALYSISIATDLLSAYGFLPLSYYAKHSCHRPGTGVPHRIWSALTTRSYTFGIGFHGVLGVLEGSSVIALRNMYAR